jgi:hypothetical protein
VRIEKKSLALVMSLVFVCGVLSPDIKILWHKKKAKMNALFIMLLRRGEFSRCLCLIYLERMPFFTSHLSARISSAAAAAAAAPKSCIKRSEIKSFFTVCNSLKSYRSTKAIHVIIFISSV